MEDIDIYAGLVSEAGNKDKVQEVDLKTMMEDFYIDYSMSVIASRALPDVRDGLKPVQRRILYSMLELSNTPDKPHRKCARIVGDTMGKYHPHGDSSIYGALVNMAQDWSMRNVLVDGHGNFGSMDGDEPAAMRYTEARLSKLAMEMLADITKETVDFVPNFDETESEPSVLPARIPNLLVNGTTGIAVGMATNIPPHNLREVISAVVRIIDDRIADRETTVEDVMGCVPGPDFPTAGVILGRRGIEEAYRTGKGKIIVRGAASIETDDHGRNHIVITEVPYGVNKAMLYAHIADLVKLKKVDGVVNVRDESNREGVRLVVDLRKDASPQLTLNQLYKHSELQSSFAIMMLALVNNEPKVLNLLQMLKLYLAHQEDVVTRRTKYDLRKAQERDHILQGLLKALDIIDEVIRTIRASKNGTEAEANLVEQYAFSEIQAHAIVEMRLRALTNLEREKLLEEHNDLVEKIARWEAILADNKLLLGVIKDEILEVSDKYGDDRRTRIEGAAGAEDVADISRDDTVPMGDTVIARTALGYIKRMTVDYFKTQGRGGKGIRGMKTIDDDCIEDLLTVSTHDYIYFFTSRGRVYRLKAYDIPEAGRNARGIALVNLLNLTGGERVTAMEAGIGDDKKYIFMATKYGTVKKTPIEEMRNVGRGGLNAINLHEDDELIEVKPTTGEDEIYLVTKLGMCVRFPESGVRPMGRGAAGVRGINLGPGDCVAGMQTGSDGNDMLVVSQHGIGKCTALTEFPMHNRGGKGTRCYKLTDKTGPIVGIRAVSDGDEVMIITTDGIIIQISVGDIRNSGRVTSGVKLINLADGVSVAQVAKIIRRADVQEDVEPSDAVGSEIPDTVGTDESNQESDISGD